MGLFDFDKLKKDLASKVDQIAKDTAASADKLSKSASETVNNIHKTIAPTLNQAVDTVSKTVAPKLNQSVKAVQKKSEEIQKSITPTLEKIKKDVDDTAGNISETIAPTLTVMKNGADSLLQSAGDTLTEGTKELQKIATDVTESQEFKTVIDGLDTAGGYAVKAGKVVSGVQAYEDRNKAIAAKEEADKIKKHVDEETERIRLEVNNALADFGQVRLKSLKDVVGSFLKCIKRMGKNFNSKEYEILNNIEVTPQEIKQLETIEMNATEALQAAAGPTVLASMALAGVPTVVTASVGALATASTGTAISTLSGAAASNAIMAWWRFHSSGWRWHGSWSYSS